MSLSKGLAGEHFVCFDCLMQDYQATIVTGQLRYDIILSDKKTGDVYKIQVKTSTTTTTEGKSYQYVLKYMKSQKNRPAYKAKDVDLFAFVNCELKKVSYIPFNMVVSKWKVTIQTTDYDLHTLDRALDYLRSNKTTDHISKRRIKKSRAYFNLEDHKEN